MRYGTQVFFQKRVPGAYDSDTGNYEEDKIQETLKYASVMDTQTKMLKLVYGSIKQGSLTLHIQNHYKEKFDHIRIGEKIYQIDYTRKLRTKQTFIVSEMA